MDVVPLGGGRCPPGLRTLSPWVEGVEDGVCTGSLPPWVEDVGGNEALSAASRSWASWPCVHFGVVVDPGAILVLVEVSLSAYGCVHAFE